MSTLAGLFAIGAIILQLAVIAFVLYLGLRLVEAVERLAQAHERLARASAEPKKSSPT